MVSTGNAGPGVSDTFVSHLFANGGVLAPPLDCWLRKLAIVADRTELRRASGEQVFWCRLDDRGGFDAAYLNL